MKMKAKRTKKIGLLISVVFVLTAVFALFTLAADDDFEKSLASFPESYKPYLRTLHEKHPQWEFVALETGLDWNTVIDNEYGEQSLVDSSASSRIWKSHDEGDYDISKDTFVQKDSGFVQGNRFAVEYFMDPRNFLTEEGIFQFESLNFNDSFTVEAVEAVLKGSFMSETKITYLNSKGKTVKTSKTYAQVIYNAGKKYDINPCYLASKILNEVGTSGSYSVWGDHADYPGIYNFYNIGATDGTGAIARGLLWATGGTEGSTTYGRPWTTPEKSILGGAQFLASQYIAKGQYTGYLQRFNVNPNGSYSLYTHQYMTNLTGALSQGYSTYASYVKMGMLENKYIFTIPVYKNMDSADSVPGAAGLVESAPQYGKTTAAVKLRSGPSQSYASLVTVPNSTTVTVISKSFTDAGYYTNILNNPIWYQVSFTLDSKQYTGYVSANYVDIQTVTRVPIASYDLALFKSSTGSGGNLLTSNYLIASVTDSDTVKFLKKGTVEITYYNSTGAYDKVKYTAASSYGSYTASNIKTTISDSSVKVTADKLSSAVKYGFYIRNSQGNLIQGGEVTSNSYTFTNLDGGDSYTVFARYVLKDGYTYGSVASTPVVTKPNKVENLSFHWSDDDQLVLTWDTVKSCTGYKVYSYNPDTAKYTRIGTVKSNTGSFTVPEQYETANYYMVRAYSTFGSTTSDSSYSEHLDIKNAIAPVQNLKFSKNGVGSITVKWSKHKKAESYDVYLYDPETKTYTFKFNTTSTNATLKDLTVNAEYHISVSAVRTVDGVKISSVKATVTALAELPKVTGFKVSNVTSTSYKLSWSEIPDATSYIVYRKVGSKYQKLKTVTSNSYTVNNLEPSTLTYYKVLAKYTYGGETLKSKAAAVYSAATTPGTVTNITSKPSYNSVTLKWNAVNDAYCYKVYIYADGKYTYKANVTENKCTLTDLNQATDYTIAVRAYIKATSGAVKGKLTKHSFVTQVKPISTITATDITSNSLTLKWSAPASSVNKYYVYKYDESKNKYVRIGTTTKTSYKVTDLTAGSSIKFKVKPAVVKNGKDYTRGVASAAFTFKTKLAKVTNVKVAGRAKTAVRIKWSAVERATNYRIYQYNPETGKYVHIANTKSTEFRIEGLNPGETYKFKVRATRGSDGTKYYGYYSSVVTVTTKN